MATRLGPESSAIRIDETDIYLYIYMYPNNVI